MCGGGISTMSHHAMVLEVIGMLLQNEPTDADDRQRLINAFNALAEDKWASPEGDDYFDIEHGVERCSVCHSPLDKDGDCTGHSCNSADPTGRHDVPQPKGRGR